MTPAEAKKLLATKLDLLGLGVNYSHLTAKTVGFTDLARAECVFVTVHGWKGHHHSSTLLRFARQHGFRVQFRMAS